MVLGCILVRQGEGEASNSRWGMPLESNSLGGHLGVLCDRRTNHSYIQRATWYQRGSTFQILAVTYSLFLSQLPFLKQKL